jgi:hypothetical protein
MVWIAAIWIAASMAPPEPQAGAALDEIRAVFVERGVTLVLVHPTVSPTKQQRTATENNRISLSSNDASEDRLVLSVIQPACHTTLSGELVPLSEFGFS